MVLLVMYMITGFYTVEPKEVGVVTRFGKFLSITGPGLHYHLPYPFESVNIVNVTDVRRVEIGYRTIKPAPDARYQDMPEEALMLTGDLSIVSVEATVLYKIKNAADFIFKVQNPENTVKDAAEAALRQIVGLNTINDILTSEKAAIQAKTRQLLQEILDKYETGIMVVGFLLQDVSVPPEVEEAYRDVASAKEDKQKKINEALAYKNQIIPKARGEAAKIINEAEAYKAARIAQAKGDVARFEQILTRYKMGEDVTRIRLYLETMEKVLPGLNKIIIPEDSAGVLKLLNLNQEKGGEK
ncbi:HflK protein [Anoxybacter fermentans]|uniref:Protein HflK n=1 Tax=Anoxybacter fermentans TaxID=1323375 RepID=A0A3S9T2X2_9FIRM|nr:HflK protein [Anoxybacter fermentans]